MWYHKLPRRTLPEVQMGAVKSRKLAPERRRNGEKFGVDMSSAHSSQNHFNVRFLM